jgi:hypothetical protein
MKTIEKKVVKSTAKKLGFYVSGSFLIGTRNEDVVTGFAVDSAPSSTYLWTFVLPAFDKLPFMHMSLGNRVLNLTDLGQSLEASLMEAWRDISPISSADQLIRYLDAKRIVGEYADWTRLICLVRLGQFDRADNLLELVRNYESASIPEKLVELEASKSYGGWPAVQDLFGEWSIQTDQLMPGIPTEVGVGN